MRPAINLFRVLLVLWAGSLWSLAAWVAPTLFYAQSDRHLAGFLAARLFSIETYLGLAVAAMALLLPGRSRMGGVYAAAALLAVNEWVLKRFMETGARPGSGGRAQFRRLARRVGDSLHCGLRGRSASDLEAALSLGPRRVDRTPRHVRCAAR